MRKLILIALAAAAYYVAGMYRQMPLMILAVIEWILLVFLFFLPHYLKRRMTLSFPAQNNEAEKGSEKQCFVRIGCTGIFPLKKVCVKMKVYDDDGVLVQEGKVKKTVDAFTGTIELGVSCAHCGILRVQICKIYLYDYFAAFSAAKTMGEEMKLIVLPKAKALRIQPVSAEAVSKQEEEFLHQSGTTRFGNESREIRQIREYRAGDTMRYVHWNQSAKTGKLWFKEFERENEAAFEILLDMTVPEDWKRGERDGFYEVASALMLGFLKMGYDARVCWYDGKASAFVTFPLESKTDYRSVMRKLYQSEFIEQTEAVEKEYEKKQARSHYRLLKCNLLLECYDVKGFGREELRHRFTYENLEKELSGDYILSLR